MGANVALILLLLQSTILRIDSYLVIDKLSFRSNEKYANATFWFENLVNGTVLVGRTIEYYQEILQAKYKVEVKAALPSSSTYDYNVLTTTFDQCKASQGILTTMFTRTVYGKIDAKDVPKCPFKKGISTMSNILITDDFIPTVPKMIFPDGKAKFIVKSLLYGKIASSKKLVTLFNWEVIGTVAK